MSAGSPGGTDPTGQAFVQLWTQAGARRLMNAKTAGAYASACESVLSATIPGWQTQDMLELDVEHTIARFRGSHKARSLADSTVQHYENVFRRAMSSFRDYVRDPDSWMPPVRSRRSTIQDLGSDSATPATPAAPAAPAARPAETTTAVPAGQRETIIITLIDAGATADLVVPSRKLTARDRATIKNYIDLLD